MKKPESLPPPVKTESKSETEPSKKAPREPEPSKSFREDFKSKRESSKNSEVVPAKIAKQTKANDVHQTGMCLIFFNLKILIKVVGLFFSEEPYNYFTSKKSMSW